MRLSRRLGLSPVPDDDDLEAFLRATTTAAEHPSAEGALDAILDSAISLVGGDEGSIMLLVSTSMVLRVVASRGLGADAKETVVPVGQGIAGSVAVSGQALLLPSTIDVDRFIGFTPKTRAIFGAVCVPLRARGEIVGVLSVNMMRPGPPFGQRELKLVSMFGESAGLTLLNARLLTDSRRHARELEMLRGATVRLSATLELPTVTEVILRESLSIAGSDTGFVCVAAQHSKPLELARFAGMSKDRVRAFLSGPGLRQFGATTDIRFIKDPAADPAVACMADDLQGRALAVIPLTTPEGSFGGVIGVALPPDVSADTKRLLWTYAVQAGAAISNALLHRTVALRERELDSIVSSLDLPIVLIDEEGRYRSINAAAAALLGLVPDFELGRPVRGTLSQELESVALDNDGDVTVEVAVHVDHQERTYRVLSAAVTHGGGRLLVLVDLTGTRELDRRKADFLAVIGHELRTPLTSIKGYAQTLLKHHRSLAPEVVEQSVGSIVSQSERLGRLIEDLLYVSRVETHRPPVHVAWDDVIAIVSGIATEVTERTPDQMVSLSAPRDLPVLTDRIKVEQILSHLIDNASKYSSGKPIMIHVEADERTVRIEVRDEGVGIFSGDLERIFEPFTQVDSSSTRVHGGTGLGLYVCRTLATTIGGTIEVDSAIGRGSTFTLVLPLRANA